jgi:dTDP-4-amino-4,6-dideoxygalactose transaminase
MTDLAAAIGIHQLRRADDFRERRERCAAWYREALADVPQIEFLHVAGNVQHAWHLLVIQLRLEELKINRNAFIEKLTAAGIGSSVHWMPLHMHPYYRETCGYRSEDYPVAAAAFERIVSLPIFPGMTQLEVQRVAQVIRQIVNNQGQG